MENQTFELVVNPKEFGIEETKANDLLGNLPQIKSERKVLESQYSEIIKMDINDPETVKKARTLRLLIRDNRTKGLLVWHQTTKDFFLQGGRFIDAIKNKEIAENNRMEEALEQIEKHAEIQEQKRQKELSEKRIFELDNYKEFVPFGLNFGIMPEDEFQKVLNGAKLQLEAKIEAEKKAERERIENERLDKLESERRLEIAPFVQFISESHDLRNMTDVNYSNFLQNLQKAKFEYEKEQERIRIENERLRLEKEKAEKEAQKIKAENEKKLAKERADAAEKLRIEQEKAAKIQKELEDKKAAEKLEIERKNAEIEKQKKEAEKLAKAPIKDKISIWVDSFKPNDLDTKGFSKEQIDLVDEIIGKFGGFKKWAKSEIEKI